MAAVLSPGEAIDERPDIDLGLFSAPVEMKKLIETLEWVVATLAGSA